METVDKLRSFSGWIYRGIVNKKLEVTHSHLPLDEEYWLALRYPAEVATAGKALLSVNNPRFAHLQPDEQEACFREFRAYIRQAEGFYRGACVLPWKSSPLNYYYSFMNLAKAMGIARGVLTPEVVPHTRRLRHGLTAVVDSGPPDIWKLIVQGQTDIFALLYKMVIDCAVAQNTELDAHQLLNYVSPIAWQLSKSGYGPRGWYPSYWVIAMTEKESWDILVVPQDAPLNRLPATFDTDYQEVSIDAAKSFAMQVLRLHAIQSHSFRFLQRKVPFGILAPGVYNVSGIEQALKAAAPHCVFENLDSTEYHLALGIPFQTATSEIPMNESIATYAVMYFLSSLVRYHPEYMDAIGESSDAWLIESFAKSAPLYLLRYLVNGVLGYTLIIESA
jgi:YaaC-like Protein